MMYTAGSNAVTSYYVPLRIVGAQARRVLLDNAAHKWGVPVEELTTEPSVVVHAKSGRRLSYGDIAAFAEVPAKAPDIKPEQLKKAADFRLIGKDVMRVELPGQGQRQRYIRHRRAGAGHAVRHGAAGAGRRIGPGQDRRRKGQGGARRHSGHQTAARRRRSGANRVGSIRSAASADRVGHLDPDRRGLGLRQRQGCRRLRGRCQEPFALRHATGAHKAMPVAHSRTRPTWSKASIAATMPITRRWSR